MNSLLPCLLLLLIGALGMIGHNMAVVYAAVILLVIRITPLARFFPFIETQGVNIGIIILTVGVIAPLANGDMTLRALVRTLADWKSVAAIVIGIFVSWLGGRGVSFLSLQPGIVGGLLVGTIIGVAFFRFIAP
ncbi:DUF441 domain-containing protein [Tatumella sp. JGM130]|uniref:DUF441 domain-containing protein n=1 Tax=Tatumella sp. JGM130 TaxID=2799797 RepID=UPI001BB0249E|nr:DUF441 domain-containing protein [Tatumella sp. JGM130]MBS0895056.1 DUF441 domain-containing protein [Tatumella sp. JGM130]